MTDFNENSSGQQPGDPEPGQNKPQNNNFVDYPLISPIAAAFLGLVGGFFLYQFVGGILTIAIFGMELEKADVNALRLMTMGGQLLFILLPALLFARWIYGDISDVIYTKIPNLVEIVLFSAGVIILIPLLQSYLYIQNYFIEKIAANSVFFNSIKTFLDSLNELAEKTYSNLMKANSFTEILLVILVISIVPAIAEETMFRGYIQRSFSFKMKPYWAALITAIFFGLYHFNPYGLLPLIALGFYFGYASYVSETIIIPMILHFLNNFGAVILYYTIGDDELINTNVSQSVALNSNILVFVVLLLLFGIIIFIIKKYYSKVRYS